jgi:glycosyltransferase 2 family protein
VETKRRYRITRSVVSLIFLGAAVHFVLPYMTTFETARQTLSSLWGFWLFAALAAQLLSYVASGGLVSSVVRLSGDSVTPARGVLITLASNTMGTLGGGFLTTATTSYRWVRQDASTEAAALSGWLPPIINNLVLLGISNWGLLVLLVAGDLNRGVALTLTVLQFIAAAAFIAMTWGIRHESEVLRRIRKAPFKLHSAVENIFASIQLLSKRAWRKPVLYSCLNICFDAATLWLLFRAVQHPIGLSVLFAGYAIPQLLGKVLFLPGGVGAVEASMVALYASLGVRYEVGVIVTLAYRAISFWIPTLLGLIAAPYLEHTSRQKKVA